METESNARLLTGEPSTFSRLGRTPLSSAGGHRRFTLVDGMILVAASAVALVIFRTIVEAPHAIEMFWTRILAATFGVLFAGTPTLLFLRLRHPRPTLHRLSRQPGFVASLTGSAILALGLLAIGFFGLLRVAHRLLPVRPGVRLSQADPSWWLSVIFHFDAVVGPAVIAAWLLLALSGRRRPHRGWLDILGRVTGVVWIVLFALRCWASLAYLLR